ncbi:MAG: helicase-related protein [Candidatus Nitrosocaldus sp.]
MLREGSKVIINENGIKEGRRIEEGIILEIKGEFAKVLLRDMHAQYYPLEQLEDKSNELIERLITGNIDEVIDFILAIDAYRLLTEYKFNPYVLASSTKIQIFPHQIDEVVKVLDSNVRMLIADEVGLGKTITAALIASELKARGLADKMLFVVPKSLVIKWRDELKDRFEFNVEILDSNYANINPDALRREEFCYVTSIDYLKQDHVISRLFGIDIKKYDKGNDKENDRRRKKEKERGKGESIEEDEQQYPTDVRLDLVVIDEAHKLANNNERYRLGRLLAGITNYMLFLTATPHNGDDEDYLNRLRLLDPYVYDINASSYLAIRNMKEDVIDLDGKEVFPARESKTIAIPLKIEEAEVLDLLDAYLAKIESYANDKQEESAIRFISTIFRKRASSSFHALRLSLERRLAKLSSLTTTLGIGFDPQAIDKARRKLKEAEEENDENEYEDNEGEIIGQSIFRARDDELRIIKEIIAKLNNLNIDSKFDELIRYILNIRKDVGDKNARDEAKIVIFTEYRDTLNYLKDRLQESFPDFKIYSIDGTMSIEERKKALESFKLDGDIMICTDAAGEGIDMQFCNIMINYDIPWNPNRLEQRMGRIHRIKQRRNVKYYNFIMDPAVTIDGYILSKLFEKIEKIREAYKDKVYDIIGRIITEDEFINLYEELRRLPRDQWEARLKASIDEITENRLRTLERINGLITGYKLDRTKLEGIRKVLRYGVDSNEVKRFVEVFINRYEGSIQPIDDEGSLYRIFMPTSILYQRDNYHDHDQDLKGIINGSFDQSIAESKNYTYLALGNKHIMLMLKHAAKGSVTVARFNPNPNLNGILFVYMISMVDGKYRPVNGRIVSILCREGSDEIMDVESRAIWDLGVLDDRDKRTLSAAELTTRKILELKDKADKKAYELMNELMKDTVTKLNIIKDRTIDAMENYYANKIEKIDKRLQEYRERLVEAQHYEGLIKIEENKREKLREEYEKMKKAKENEFKVYPIIELIGIALIKGEDEGGRREEVKEEKEVVRREEDMIETINNERIKKLVELNGIKIAIEYEKERAGNDPNKLNSIKDVSNKYAGYDIESFDRVIEVKAFKDTGSIQLTSHEWLIAKKLGDEYYIYAIEDALGKGRLTVIQNPAKKFANKVKPIQVIDYKYVIEDWKDNGREKEGEI